MKSSIISKTAFLKYEQCQKAFFLYKNHPYLKDKVSADTQITFNRGHNVGFFAQQLFPNGIDVSLQAKNATEAHLLTLKLIEENTSVIYEATFIYKGVLVMVDILCLENNIYKAYEVKSSIKVSEVYLKDACLQYYVLKNSLQNFNDLFLVTLNADYILNGEINPKLLFKKRSVKKQAEQNIEFFTEKIAHAHLVLEQNKIPNVSIGKHCFKPYQCDFFGTCWKDVINEDSVFNLPRINKDKLFEWFDSELKEIHQLTEESFNELGGLEIRTAFLNKTPIINANAILDFLNLLTPPCIAMDMEIWATAIPKLQNTKPFEQVPFLACFYDGKEHVYFITDHPEDERYMFAQQLILNTKNYNTILVYDKTMEALAINKLIELFPELKEALNLVLSKIVDVFPIVSNFHYYHPKFKNNFSLKAVADVLFPNITYSTIQSGLQAMSYFENYRNSLNIIEKEELKQSLITYCQTDTLATFELVNFLKAV
ncbi:MAG: DUF2779 domain-containing protein [Bacteroidota bacterium]|nr:DUF2779 domain-containing protein [Bacteroidota bacterium]